MAADETEELRLDFGNLPLVEAAVRASFASQKRLTYGIVNDVRERLKDDFPQLDEPQHIEVAPGVGRRGEVRFIPSTIGGAVYTGNQRGLSITVQDQVIVVRWLPGSIPKTREYPRYAALRDALRTAVSAFRQACGREAPAILVVNMSYVNFVRVTHASPVLRTYFSESVRVDLVSKAHEVQKFEVAWREQDATDLRFNLDAVLLQEGDETVEGYRLETAGGRRLAQGDDEVEVLDRVHRRMQVFFRDLLSADAKREWDLREVPRV